MNNLDEEGEEEQQELEPKAPSIPLLDNSPTEPELNLDTNELDTLELNNLGSEDGIEPEENTKEEPGDILPESETLLIKDDRVGMTIHLSSRVYNVLQLSELAKSLRDEFFNGHNKKGVSYT